VLIELITDTNNPRATIASNTVLTVGVSEIGILMSVDALLVLAVGWHVSTKTALCLRERCHPTLHIVAHIEVEQNLSLSRIT